MWRDKCPQQSRCMAIHTFTDQNESQNNQCPVIASPTDFNIPELQRTLKLAGMLQTSLEIDSILQYFIDTAQEVVPFSGVHYDYEPLNFTFVSGKAERHSCAYRLRIVGEDIGEIRFSRNKRFSEAEMEQVENLIYHLVYPLRNAIQYQQALRAAQMDSLTGVNNRAALDRCLEREVELAHRHEHDLSILMVDVDHFKIINDTHGHSVGDTVLKVLVDCMQQTMRVSDMLFRFGGEEFVLLLSGTDIQGARQMAERLRNAVQKHPFVHEHLDLDVTVSIGVATLGPRDSARRLFDKADTALYEAKTAGRNRVRGHAEMAGQSPAAC